MLITLTLPNNAIVKVKQGDQVTFGDRLYQIINKKDEIKLNIAKNLHIQPQHIFRYLQKMIGEEIKKGETIAKKKGVLATKKLVSQYEGLLKEIDHQTGEITLSVSPSENQIDNTQAKIVDSNFKGILASVGKEEISIEVVGEGKKIDLKEINRDGAGEIFHFKDAGFYFTIGEDQIREKIIAIEELKSHIEAKCEALGGGGFIFLKGEVSTELPAAKIKNIDDYHHLVTSGKKYIIFSKKERVAIIYD